MPSAAPGTIHAELGKRLRILAVVTAVAFLAVAVLCLVLPTVLSTTGAVIQRMFWLAKAGCVSALALAWAAPRIRSRWLVQAVGHGYTILIAAAMAVTEVSLMPDVAGPRWGISGIGVWLVLVPLVFPGSTRATGLTALLSASTIPIAYLAGRLLGLPPQPAEALIQWILPLYFCAALATTAAWSINRYRTALAQARRELQELGSWKPVQRLRAGGMGEVWIARHGLLPRLAAVKFATMPAELSDDERTELIRRFEAEAAATATLSSLHTVTVYDYGLNDQGERFLVMELLDGVDLHHAIDTWGPWPDWRVARCLIQACRSLVEAHQRGLVHRDIKPANLMVCRLGDELDVVKVLDFGLAGTGHQGPGDDDAVWGSVGYIAPEALTTSHPLDGRSDLYALGCVAWFLLTGRSVFSGSGATHVSIAHCTETPDRRRLPPTTDPALIDLLLALLAKRPAERPADARRVRERLESLACLCRYDPSVVETWWRQVPAFAVPETPSSARLTAVAERVDGRRGSVKPAPI